MRERAKKMLPKFTKQSGLRKKESSVTGESGYVGVSRIDGATKGTVQ